MSNNKQQLSYKGYTGSVNVDIGEAIIYGEILFINDLITYEAESIKQLNHEFELAVSDYIDTCKTLNRDPQKPFSGSLNVRIGPELHKQAAVAANHANISLNKFIKNSITKSLTDENRTNTPAELHLHNHAHTKSEDVTTEFPYTIEGVDDQWKYN